MNEADIPMEGKGKMKRIDVVKDELIRCVKKIKKDDAAKLLSLENMLVRITQQDVVYRRYLVPDHRSFVPDFGVFMKQLRSAGVKTPVEVSADQIARFGRLYPMNARPTQPRNDRDIVGTP